MNRIDPRRGRARDRGQLNTTWLIGGIIALVVVVAGSVAIISATGDDDSPATVTVVDSVTGSVVEVVEEQTRPVVVTGTALAPLPADGSADPSLGATIPTVTGQSFDGTALTIAPGKNTLVLFVAHWCVHCQAEVPRMVEWFEQGDVPAGLEVMGVSTATTDTRENYPPSDWLRSESFPWPVLADSPDSEAAAAFGVSAFPFFVLYDASGTVVLRTSGEVETDQLNEMIATALGT